MMSADIAEASYKTVCAFEKVSWSISKKRKWSYCIFSFDLEDTDRQFPTQSITYTSYQNLFEEQYKDAFLTSIEALDWKELHHTLGTGTLDTIMTQDATIRMHYEQITKERDLDNDGTSDRIDIDDTNNAVQTIGDRDKVKTQPIKKHKRIMRITQRRMRRDSTEKVMIWNYKGGISMGILKFTMRAVIKLLIFTITISFAIIKFVFLFILLMFSLGSFASKMQKY